MFELILTLIIIALAVFLIRQSIKQITMKPEGKQETLTPYLCSVSKLRKKDGNIKKGECSLIFNDDTFEICQNEEKIINDIDSIYYFDIWNYKDDTYFKIRMRSLTEYIFKSVHFEADITKNILRSKGIKIEDNRNE